MEKNKDIKFSLKNIERSLSSPQIFEDSPTKSTTPTGTGATLNTPNGKKNINSNKKLDLDKYTINYGKLFFHKTTNKTFRIIFYLSRT